MAEIVVESASGDDVRSIQNRRHCDEAAVRLSLESAERGSCWVARDEGETLGILVARDYDDERYIGDLFVEPSYRGQGVALQLLAVAFEEAGDRARSLLVDAADPAGAALALRYGMALREPVFRLAGEIPKEEELLRMAAGDYRFAVEPIDPIAHAFGLRALDRQTRGITRDDDHLGWVRAAGNAFFLGGEFVAYVYVWPDGRIGPLASASPAYLVQIFAYALRASTQRFGASWCTLLLPGSNVRVARAALRAGLRVQETFIFGTDSTMDLSTYVGYHRLRF